MAALVTVMLAAAGRATAAADEALTSEQAAETESSRVPRDRIGLGFESGAALHEVYGLPYWGPSLGLEVGLVHGLRSSRRLFAGATADLRWGDLDHLSFVQGSLGGRVQFWLGDVVSLGVGGHVFCMSVPKATQPASMWLMAGGFDWIVAFDVLHVGDDHALFIAIEPSVDVWPLVVTSLSVGAGVDARVGFRW